LLVEHLILLVERLVKSNFHYSTLSQTDGNTSFSYGQCFIALDRIVPYRSIMAHMASHAWQCKGFGEFGGHPSLLIKVGSIDDDAVIS